MLNDYPITVTVIPSVERLERAIQASFVKFLIHQEQNPRHTGECARKTPSGHYLAQLIHNELKGDINGN